MLPTSANRATLQTASVGTHGEWRDYGSEVTERDILLEGIFLPDGIAADSS
jgi:hypothetical protein